MERPTWDEQHMAIAQLVARRATCDRARVGCALVVNQRIVSTGYNDSLPGAQHCDAVGHLMHEGHCIRTVHAEGNALADAAKRGVAVDGATAYCTHSPCPFCLKLLLAAGIRRIVYANERPDIQTAREFCAMVLATIEATS